MSIRDTAFYIEQFYHIFNHGNGDCQIFLDDHDKRRMTNLLYVANGVNPFVFTELKGDEMSFDRGETLVDIGAWCLMDNHYHLLLKEKRENGITLFMHKLMTAYTSYFNIRHQTRGTLFEGKFKAKIIEFDEYLEHMYAYIHLNPVKMIEPSWKVKPIKDKKKALNYLEEYHYSSYQDYLKKDRPEKAILNMPTFPDYFSNQNVKMSMFKWLDFENYG